MGIITNGQLYFAHSYEIADILLVKETGFHFLIENIDNYEYCFRILETGNTRRDSIFYIDSHKGIAKVA